MTLSDPRSVLASSGVEGCGVEFSGVDGVTFRVWGEWDCIFIHVFLSLI